MKVLLDTHTFLWFLLDAKSLSTKAKALIEDANTQPRLSIASLWEIAIKLSLGKLQIPQPFERFIQTQLDLNKIGILPIEIRHLEKVSALPLHHHRDPFDRLLIAQATVENISIISADPAFDAYPVTRLW
jgi:PIN domain nuclease of toxin-antitoxin system